MKKILSVVALTALATSVFAQGTVGFSNGTGLVKQWTSATDSTLINVPKGGGFVQLGWAPTGTAYTPWNASLTPAAWLAANPGWKLEGTPVGFTTPAAGKFNGGSLTLAGVTPGASIDYVVVGWTGTAASFEAAYAAGTFVGVSDKFTSATGGTGDPPSPSIPLSTTFGGATLAPVPEPSTFALAGLGAAALLIFRRRS